MPAPLRPVVIQGGMGVAVSSWQLASTVARTGQLGVVSGTALDIVLARRLQDGDPGGHARRALASSRGRTSRSGCWTATSARTDDRRQCRTHRCPSWP